MANGQKKSVINFLVAPDAVIFLFVFKAHQAETADCKPFINSMSHSFNLHEA